MNIILPILYSISKNNKILIWKISVLDNEIITEYGQLGKKMIITRRESKNAELEAERKWNLKKDGSYSENIPSNNCRVKINDIELISPMLAHKYEPWNYNLSVKEQSTVSRSSEKYIKFSEGVYIQPKLDGVRCVCSKQNGNIILQSRTKKIFPHLDHIRHAMLSLYNDIGDDSVICDGELYFYKESAEDVDTFQEIIGIVANNRILSHEMESKIEYWIFDIVSPMTIKDRYLYLDTIFNNNKIDKLILVKYTICYDWLDAYELYKYYIEHYYEGMMLKSIHCLYQEGYRSNYMRKYKEAIDEEVKIVGFTEGSGREKGCIIYKFRYNVKIKKIYLDNMLDHDESKINNYEIESIKLGYIKYIVYARPVGSLKYRAEIYRKALENPKIVIGKYLTIRYIGFTNKGIPRFPRAIAIRNYE